MMITDQKIPFYQWKGAKKKKKQMIIGSLSVPAKSPINLPQNQIPLVWISIPRKNER
jgi:hypothetical protein